MGCWGLGDGWSLVSVSLLEVEVVLVSAIVEGLREGHVRQDHEEAAASKSGTAGVAEAEALGKEWTGSAAGTKYH